MKINYNVFNNIIKKEFDLKKALFDADIHFMFYKIFVKFILI
jgi:hypothetical protein